MRPSDLKIGDRIRIVAVPGAGISGYTIHADTVRVFKKLISRGRSVRICRIDKYGAPWYECRFKTKTGRWEWHSLAVCKFEDNWFLVKHRAKGKNQG